MTIQNTTIRKAGPSQGNGVTTVFPFTFKVFTATDILVTYLDALAVESVLVLSTNYTVSLNADQNTSPGGSVTLLVAPATATYITLTSQVTNTQTLALTNSGGFYPESINNALDRTVIEIQQLAEQASRAVTIPKSATASPLLPIPTPLNVLAWNVDGTAITNVSLESSSNLSSYKATGTGAVTRTVASKLNDIVSVKDFGAVGDGVTDDTAAIQAAITYVASINGGTVNIPVGTFKVTSTFTIANSNIVIQGAGSNTPHDAGTGASAATTLNYAGVSATSLYMFNFITPPNVGAAIRTGGGLLNIAIACNALLAGGLKIISWRNANFTDLIVYNSVVSAYYVSCWKTGVEVPEAADTQRCEFNRCSYRSIDSSAVYNAKGFILTSESWPTSNANTSFNSFTYCGGQSYNGTSWYIVDTDNNNFISCTGGTVGTGKGFEIWGDSNYFYDLSAGGFPSAIYIYGTASGNIYNPVANCFMYSDNGNGTNYPNLDAGCRIQWLGSDGVAISAKSQHHVISDSNANANNISPGTVSLVIDNSSDAGLAFTKGGVLANYWSIGFGSGTTGNDLRILTTTNGTLNLSAALTTITGTTSPKLKVGDYTIAGSFSIPIIEVLGSRQDGNGTFEARYGAAYRRSDGTAIASGTFLGAYAFGGQVGTSTSYSAADLLYAASIIGIAEGSFTTSTAMATGIDFRTGSTGELLSSVGTTYGTSRLRIQSDGVVRPGADNTQTLGSASFRWSTVYAGTGTINTSDERTKQQIKPIDDAALRAWAKVEYCQFKFNDAVETKGDGARWHIGLIAQRVEEAFTSEGLNAFDYGLLCYDEWDAIEEDVLAEEPYVDDEGEEQIKYIPTGEKKVIREAGNRYGIRYEEALALECAYLRSKLGI